MKLGMEIWEEFKRKVGMNLVQMQCMKFSKTNKTFIF